MSNMPGIRDFPVYSRNPYFKTLVVPTRNKIVAMGTRQLPLFDPDTGEVEEMALMAVRQRVDKEPFVKIYKAQIQAMFNLSNRAMRVFGYFMDATRISDDMVYFSLKRCMEYTGYSSKATVLGGVADLLDAKFIARTDEPNTYFINPAKFFNGDRMVIVQDYVRKGSEADLRLQDHDPLLESQQGKLELPEPENEEETA